MARGHPKPNSTGEEGMPESKRDEGNYVLTVKGNADCEYPKRGDLDMPSSPVELGLGWPRANPLSACAAVCSH